MLRITMHQMSENVEKIEAKNGKEIATLDERDVPLAVHIIFHRSIFTRNATCIEIIS